VDWNWSVDDGTTTTTANEMDGTMNPTITTTTISLAITIIGGWMWVTTFFMTRADADSIHAAGRNDLRETYLELKIDQANTEMAFIEQGGVQTEETRGYELLKFSVQRMTQQLMDLQ
jgi:hypothetical protein